MTIRIPKLTAEHFFKMFLVLFWGQDVLFSYIRGVFLRIPYIKYAANYIIPTLMIICLVFALPYIAKAISKSDIIFFAIVVGVFLIHIFAYPSNTQNLISICGSFFTVVFPLYFIGLRLDKSHLNAIYIMSLINIWAFVIYTFISGDGSTGNQAGYMSYMNRAYVLLSQLLVVIGFTFKNVNAFNIITSVVGFIFLLMCGNRGSVIILLTFVLIYVALVTEKKRRIVLCTIIIVATVIVSANFEIIVGFLMIAFSQIGMSTRIFERVLEGTFMVSQGRNAISKTLWSAICKNPVFGYGIASDRLVSGSYAHNYVMELWVSFGLIIGSLVFLATIYLILRAWFVTKDKESKIFLLVLICVSFLKLFISSSFLEEGMFFMLLGFCIAQVRNSGSRHIKLRGV